MHFSSQFMLSYMGLGYDDDSMQRAVLIPGDSQRARQTVSFNLDALLDSLDRALKLPQRFLEMLHHRDACVNEIPLQEQVLLFSQRRHRGRRSTLAEVW